MKKLLKKINLFPDKNDFTALWVSYLIINIIYLYNTLNFMWGNHDIQFMNDGLSFSSGLFEGRFTQFIPSLLLTDGQILPITNNLIGFFFLSLGLWLLAKYWNIPKTPANYIIFIVFFASLPYTLSWLYFTFITISCLLWIFIAVLGLYLSDFISKSHHKIFLSCAAILCFYAVLGGYPPVINTIFVGLCGKLLLSYLYEKKNLKSLFNIHKYTVLNISISAILFKLTLKFIRPDNVYNLTTTPLAELPQKFLSVINISLNQFIITLPFMERSWKILLLLLVICALISAIINAETIKTKLITVVLFGIVILSAAVTTLISVPHTEYVARIDFYGLAFVYAFALAILLQSKKHYLKVTIYSFATIIIFLNIINDYRAQKIWQQAFEAEYDIVEQMYERIESHPNFNPSTKYRFYHIGDISLRPTLYHQKFDKNEPFLLSMPYLATWQGAPLLEFYAPFSFIDRKNIILPEDITPEVYNFFIKEAHPWPHPNSLYINNDILIVIYNETGLTEFKQKITELHQNPLQN